MPSTASTPSCRWRRRATVRHGGRAGGAGANVKQAFEKLRVLSKQLDTLVIGVGLNPSSKALFVDFESCGVEGSDLAKKSAALKEAKTDFAGFALPGLR